MKSLSQAEYGELRGLYQSIYAPKQVDEEIEISDEELTEIIEETVIELLEEGYTAEEIEESFDDEFVDEILIEAMTPKQKEMRAKFKAQQARDSAATTRTKDKNARDKNIADTKAAIKSAPGRALRSVARGTERAEKAAKRKTNQAKGAVASAALKATGTKLKGKKGQDLTSSQTHTQHKKVRDQAKAAIKANFKNRYASAKKTAGKAIRGAVASVQMKKSDPDKSIKSRIDKARSGLKGMIGKAARNVSNKADKAASRLGEEVETYDVVVEFLCDQGIAEDLQEAQWMMVNEIDSEDIATILEAYGLDEEVRGARRGTIRAVIEKGGKSIKYVPSGGDIYAGDKAAQERADAAEKKRRGKNRANAARAEQARKKSIENMNNKELKGTSKDDYVQGMTEKQPVRGLGSIRTDRAARARRASGR